MKILLIFAVLDFLLWIKQDQQEGMEQHLIRLYQQSSAKLLKLQNKKGQYLNFFELFSNHLL